MSNPGGASADTTQQPAAGDRTAGRLQREPRPIHIGRHWLPGHRERGIGRTRESLNPQDSRDGPPKLLYGISGPYRPPRNLGLRLLLLQVLLLALIAAAGITVLLLVALDLHDVHGGF